MDWAVGVTTTLSRKGPILSRTLESLKCGGFNSPHLFVDGDCDGGSWREQYGLEVTCRGGKNVRTFGNWVLSIYEVYIRNPHADRYALFQDDFITYKNLRPYLERCTYPEKGYWNLYTFPSNHGSLPDDGRGGKQVGWHLSNQLGRGAVALVFSKEVLTTLLSLKGFLTRIEDHHRGWRCVDGGIVDNLKTVGIKEYVHWPSLTQHTGRVSAMDKRKGLKEYPEVFPAYTWPESSLASSFRGESFDALSLSPP